MLTNATPKVRIAIADDHPVFLHGLQTVLNKQSDFEIVAVAHNGTELISTVQQQHPDVVLTDIHMPELNGLEATLQINKESPKTAVIGISTHAEEHLLVEMLKAGAKGYLLKESSREEVVHAVRAVYNKGTYYCCDITKKMITLLDEHTQKKVIKKDFSTVLTEKEKTVIRMICLELSSKEIANHLNISVRSVESMRERLQEKTGARNMIGIVLYAIKNGIHTIQ